MTTWERNIKVQKGMPTFVFDMIDALKRDNTETELLSIIA
jgi:hypothetical protein